MKKIWKQDEEIHKSIYGGIRVEGYGLITVLADAIVVSGLHNEKLRVRKVSEGYKFNSVGTIGSWDDIIPDFEKENGEYYHCENKHIPYNDVEVMNLKNQIFVLDLWKKYTPNSCYVGSLTELNYLLQSRRYMHES